MVGGPQNLYNLFSQFTPDSYCVFTTSEAINQRQVTGSKLAGEYLFFDAPASNRSDSRPEDRHMQVSGGRIQRVATLARGAVAIAYHTTYHTCKTIVTIIRMVRIGIRLVHEKKVDCLLGISDVGPALISTYLISRIAGIPYALYLFDIYQGNILSPMNRFLAKIFERRLFRRASMVIVTNEGTERFYRKRYGGIFKSAVVHNSIFLSDYEHYRTPYSPREPYVIVFTGSVYWAQERSLMNLVRALDEMADPRIRLDLYVHNADSKLREQLGSRSYVRLMAAPQSDMARVQCSATLLFLPLSWHTGAPEIIATATPGKLVDYLASGRPILIHAPPYTYLNEYAKENSFAAVVDEENVGKLKAAIRRLLSDLEVSLRLIENAKTTLTANHDAHLNARKLATILESV
jgi:glycosyltransferase involved in cell wall biosynthesis